MQQDIVYENAAQRKTYVGEVYDQGEHKVKEDVLNSLPEEWARLHRDGYIHIHDLDAYGLTYNCLTFDILKGFPYGAIKGLSDSRKVLRLFEHYKSMISKVGNEQSGGMGFGNFDLDTATILKELGVPESDTLLELLRDNIAEFLQWCNDSHERMGQVSFYVTLNIGLADSELSRFVCRAVIEEFASLPPTVFKPNIVFKVKDGVSHREGDPNYDLFILALDCTSRKMIPTYLLCDCEADRAFDPHDLSIMGCRTRVVNDLFGAIGSRGRGNVDNVSINLPRLAFEVDEELPGASDSERMELFKKKWVSIADTVTQILLDRYNKTLRRSIEMFPTVRKYNLWIENIGDADTMEENLKHGTLSFGFIGLSEAMEALTGNKYYLDAGTYEMAKDFVGFMRAYSDACIKKYNLNFSLLATSGELISGRFCELDRARYDNEATKKGFYTNSFHIDVDSNLPAFEKIAKEGPFHLLCNGGCITYVELGESPLGNTEGLSEYVDYAIKSGTHYLGFNFPLDICKACGYKGVFDTCPECGSDEITRIRRVSGYLEVLDYFVKGKKNEVRHRRKN